MPLTTCPDCGRQISDAAPACPGCGRPNDWLPVADRDVIDLESLASPSASAQPKADAGRTTARRILLVSGAVAAAILGVGIVGALAMRTHEPPSAMPAPVTSPAPAPPTEPADPVKDALIKMDHMTSADAFTFAKRDMADEVDQVSPGAAILALWAARRLRWADVYVAQDETTFAMVQKDSSEQLGKRMCSAGQVIEIHAEKPETGGHLANGILMSDSGHLYHYVVAGSSGAIGQGSYATLCGLVAGNYTYSNSAGGTGHAVEIVGMFDLPANRKPGQ